MSKGLTYTLVGLSVVVALLLGAFFVLDWVVASSTEAVGTELTGTEVTVEAASVSPFSGSGSITGFRVANPDGYEKDHAVRADEISVDVELSTLFSDPVVVRRIEIEAPVVNLARHGGETNLQTILQNVNRAEEESSSGSDMVVEHFLVTEGAVDLYVDVGGGRSARKELPRIELRNIGTEEGGLAIQEVVGRVADRVFGAALQSAGGNWADQAKDAVQDRFN